MLRAANALVCPVVYTDLAVDQLFAKRTGFSAGTIRFKWHEPQGIKVFRANASRRENLAIS